MCDIKEAWDSPLHQQLNAMQEQYRANSVQIESRPWADEDEESHDEKKTSTPVDPKIPSNYIDNMSFYTSQGDYLPSKDEFFGEDTPVPETKNLRRTPNTPFHHAVPESVNEDDDDFEFNDLYLKPARTNKKRRQIKKRKNTREKFVVLNRPDNLCHHEHDIDCKRIIGHVKYCEFCMRNLHDLLTAPVTPVTTPQTNQGKWYQSDDLRDLAVIVVTGIVLIFAFDMFLRIGALRRK